MDVVEHLVQVGRIDDVTIVTRPFLPESEHLLARTLANGQYYKSGIGTLDHPLFDAITMRPLDGTEQSRYLCVVIPRKHQEVYVLGHKDEPEQIKYLRLHRSRNRDREL